MKYFVYCRKSTDEDNRQVQSIESQEKELIQFAIQNNIDIVETYKESKTAKMPGREVFNLMLTNIEKGKAQGILSWHPDRLTRNSIDGGKVIFLMDQGVLKDLKFPTYWVDNSPQGKFNLSLAFGQSKYYIDNLSQNVKRGQREKLRRGEYPAMAPIGYINDKINKTIIPDPERAHFIKRLFSEYATNRFSIKELALASRKWGLKTSRDGILSSSTLERILKSKFYVGMIIYNKETYKGIHKPLINVGTFMQVQKILKNKAKTTQHKSIKEMLAFTGMMQCGECGFSITAEIHKGHIYYRCTKKIEGNVYKNM